MDNDSLRSLRALISKGADIACYSDIIKDTTDGRLLDSLFISLIRKYCKDADCFYRRTTNDEGPYKYSELRPGFKEVLKFLTGFEAEDSDTVNHSVLFGCSEFVPDESFPAFVESSIDKGRKVLDAAGKGKKLVEVKRKQPKQRAASSEVKLTENKRLLYDHIVSLGVAEPFCGVLTRTGQFSRNAKFIDNLEEPQKTKVTAIRNYTITHPGCKFTQSMLEALTA